MFLTQRWESNLQPSDVWRDIPTIEAPDIKVTLTTIKALTIDALFNYLML